MPVNTPHPQYSKFLSRWELVRDCIEGASAIKKRSEGGNNLYAEKGSRYLPPPNPDDISIENKSRYQSYVERASFVNFTGFTKDGMVGMVFRKPITIELPTNIDYLKTNVNGDGLFLEQLAQDVVGEGLEVGRHGLLADYPPAPPGLTKAQVTDLKLVATIKSYIAENIINWKTETIGAITRLSMVVLKEPTEVPDDDGFGFKIVDYYRVLKLVNGIYYQDLYDEKLVIKTPNIKPTKSNGKAWNEIPFVFVGAQNNDATIDKAPLYDIAEINISHYRNSADYEESSFIVGQPWPVISGLTKSWIDDVLKGAVIVGSRSALLLPENSDAKLVQANPNQMPETGMKAKEQQMIMIGARIIQDSTGQETAEAAKIRFAGQNSKLGTIVNNVENAFKKCIEWVQLYMGAEGEFTCEFNREFYEARLDPQMVMAGIALLDRGVIAKTDLRGTLRRGSQIDSDRTDDLIDQELSLENPMI